MGAEHSRRHRQMPTATDNLSSSVQNVDLVPPKKSPRMNRLRRTLSFRSRKKNNKSTNDSLNTSTNQDGKHNKTAKDERKLLKWRNDDKSVRTSTCNFSVKYLGCVEVQESRGIHICEQAIQTLLNKKGKHVKAVLHISSDALRVVDQTNKGLIVDQTIEKVSFCAPDRHHHKGFAYICRDGTTRRWLCHCFVANNDEGGRLSHAVGCAFQICLENKQKRDSECHVTLEFSQNDSSFTRFGSFRSTSIVERRIDPQSAIVIEPIPCVPTFSTNQKSSVVERPRPKGNSSDAFTRSASLRMDSANQSLNGFKRYSSLRPNDLPSIQESKSKISCRNSIMEETELSSPINELSKLSLFDTTDMNDQRNFPCDLTSKSGHIPLSSLRNTNTVSQTTDPVDSQAIILNQHQHSNSPKTSLNDAFHSNLNALVQSNNPINPFSPYGALMAAHAQSSTSPQQQSTIFSKTRGSNPFDDDLIRR